MNRVYDYNGVQVSTSKPVQKLVKVSKVLHIDSGDRDVGFFPQNGEFVLYLPRVYERVASINIKSAEFPAVSGLYSWTGPPMAVPATGAAYSLTQAYFLVEVEGLNKSDETSLGADRSAFTDAVFAKFVSSPSSSPVIYNESVGYHQLINFYPAIGRLDRLRFKLRAHGMSKNQSVYWPSGEWSMTLEIETLENSYDDYSSIETRVGERS